MYEICFQWEQQRKECAPVCVCVTKIRGTLQRFKVPITAECSSNGISNTRRAQMAPESFETSWKGHTKYRRATPTCSPTHSLLLTDSRGWFLLKLLAPHQSSERSTIILFKSITQSRTEEKCLSHVKRQQTWPAMSLMRSWQRLNSTGNLWRLSGK